MSGDAILKPGEYVEITPDEIVVRVEDTITLHKCQTGVEGRITYLGGDVIIRRHITEADVLKLEDILQRVRAQKKAVIKQPE